MRGRVGARGIGAIPPVGREQQRAAPPRCAARHAARSTAAPRRSLCPLPIRPARLPPAAHTWNSMKTTAVVAGSSLLGAADAIGSARAVRRWRRWVRRGARRTLFLLRRRRRNVKGWLYVHTRSIVRLVAQMNGCQKRETTELSAPSTDQLVICQPEHLSHSTRLLSSS